MQFMIALVHATESEVEWFKINPRYNWNLFRNELASKGFYN
jgi:hypothetical protein